MLKHKYNFKEFKNMVLGNVLYRLHLIENSLMFNIVGYLLLLLFPRATVATM